MYIGLEFTFPGYVFHGVRLSTTSSFWDSVEKL